MADKKVYLDQEGLERLVDYIQNELSQKADKGDIVDIELPEDLVYEADLADYAKKSEVVAQLPNDLVYDADIADVVRESDIADVVREAALDDLATKDELEAVEAKATSAYHFKGSVANLEALQAIEDPEQGDVYNLEDTGINAAWTGSEWDEFGSFVDLTPYLPREDVYPISQEVLDSLLYSGARAIVSDKASIDAMIANDEPEVEIVLNKDMVLSDYITIPEGKKVTLNLDGNSLSSSNVAVYANGGDLVVSNGSISSSRSDAIVVRNGGSVTVDGADITSSSSNAISAKESSITVNSGNIQSQEAGLLGFKDSVITINGGTITGIDNGPVMGNGSAAGSANDGTNMNVVMNGGTLIAHIQSAGYTACGVYVPNSGSFTMNGGEIISDGCGICQRGGTVNLNGGRIVANGAAGAVGKVGDSRVVVGSYAVVYDANSKYPAMDTLELNIAEGMELVGTDGDIQVLLADGVEANINDNR